MYNLTELELGLWQHPYPQKCTITSDDFTITDADIISGGFCIDRRSVSGSRIEIGSVIASELSLVIDNRDGRWNETTFEGASLYAQISTEDRLYSSTIPLGYFVVDNAPRRLAKITLTALDRMMQFDREYKNDITFPSTPATIVERCCAICDVPLGVATWTGFANYNATIPSMTLTNTTYREVLSHALEIMGVCGWIDWQGRFMCGWYTATTDNPLSCKESNRTSSDLGESSITIDGLRIGETDYLPTGSDGAYLINIEANPFITDDNVQTIASGLLSKLNGFTYYPASATMLPCPHVWPLDMLTFVKGEDEYPIIVSGVNFKLNGMTVLTSDGETETTSGYASANPLTKAESAIIKRVELEQTQLGEKITQLSYVNDIASNALGFHTTLVTQSDGSVIEYTHNKMTLSDSTVIYKKTASGFFLSRDGGQTYTEGFDADGNAVLNILSVNGINADWLVAGILKDRTGGENFWLNLDTGELKIGNGQLHYSVNASGVGQLSLGDESSSHVVIDNDSVDLMDGSTMIASFSLTETMIPKLKVTDYLHMGDKWEVSQNSGFSIKWIGG